MAGKNQFRLSKNSLVDFFLIIRGILKTGMPKNQKPLEIIKKMINIVHNPTTPDTKIGVPILPDFFSTHAIFL